MRIRPLADLSRDPHSASIALTMTLCPVCSSERVTPLTFPQDVAVMLDEVDERPVAKRAVYGDRIYEFDRTIHFLRTTRVLARPLCNEKPGAHRPGRRKEMGSGRTRNPVDRTARRSWAISPIAPSGQVTN
jgi:hypothetical protein